MKRLSIAFWVLPVMRICAGQEGAAPDTLVAKYYMNPVIVTATKIAAVPQNLASSVTWVDAASLERLSTGAVFNAVQAMVPGLYVTEWGAMGFGAAGSAAGKISMRGVGGGSNSCVLILRNGRPDFMGLMGCTIADEFSTDGVERIEVVRGPGSFLYGTNAIGGVINIIPKRMKTDGFATRFSAGTGAFRSQTLSFGHGGKAGAFDYYLTANARRTDGYRSDGDDNYRGNHYTLHLGYSTGLNTEFEFNGNFAGVRVFDPGPASAPRLDNWYDIIRYGGDADLMHKGRLGETNVKFHANFGKHDFFDGWKSNDRTTGLMLYQNFGPWEGQTATIGFDWKRYGGDAVDAASDYGAIFITEYAPYVHLQQVLLRRWIASAGVRLEHHNLYGTEALPKAGLVYHPFDRTSLRLSMSKGFRSPSIRELYFWMPANAGLTPDRLWNSEAGFGQQLFGRRMNFEATLFKAEGSNLIQLQSPPPKWENGGSYTHTGYELAWSWAPSMGFDAGATWSKTDLSPFAFNSPGKKLTAYAIVKAGVFSLSADLLSVMDWKGITTVNRKDVYPPMNDYTVVNLSVGTALIKGTGLKIQLRNAFDEKYEAMYGYPMPGRNFMAEMEYAF
jgi:iron complex outermembrane receptor protein